MLFPIPWLYALCTSVYIANVITMSLSLILISIPPTACCLPKSMSSIALPTASLNFAGPQTPTRIPLYFEPQPDRRGCNASTIQDISSSHSSHAGIENRDMERVILKRKPAGVEQSK
ncbi:hypothetical protein AcV5_003014 [Taiwanofungus camphoratus]|nr:hypothetical protein AcV5_003014 [Antrodia cinnamomea]